LAISRKISEAMEGGSWIRRMFEAGIALKQQYGDDKVFDLSLGNPVTDPPEEFRQGLLRLAEQPSPGMHRYMPNAGYPDTREAVAAQLREETGLPFTMGEVVMTCGAAAGMNIVLKTILEPGDEVIVLAPYFVEYCYYTDNCGGVPKIVDTDEGFNLDMGVLEEAMGPRTRAIVINSPNNPSGVVYDDASLRELGDLLRRTEERYGTEIFVLSDEPYRKLIYDGLEYPHVYKYHHASVALTSHSKDLALPGERIGYIAVNPNYEGRAELIDGCIFCNRTLGFVNAPALMQNLVRSLQDVTVDVGDYQRKRDWLYGELTGMGYDTIKPQGAFYFFPRAPIEDDTAFVEALLEWKVLAVPGRGFGRTGYFRIAYCVGDRVLEGALDGLRQAARKYGLTG
jgi:aspartate aminotransferase